MNSTNIRILGWRKSLQDTGCLSPLLTINAQENHCVRHSKGSYQSQEISHTDIHSHARTHVRYCMHCFWKFWSHNTSICSSTSCNWQPRLVPHGIIQDHLKEVRKTKKTTHYLSSVLETGPNSHLPYLIDINERRFRAQISFKLLTESFLQKQTRVDKIKGQLQIIKHNYIRKFHIQQKGKREREWETERERAWKREREIVLPCSKEGLVILVAEKENKVKRNTSTIHTVRILGLPHLIA